MTRRALRLIPQPDHPWGLFAFSVDAKETAASHLDERFLIEDFDPEPAGGRKTLRDLGHLRRGPVSGWRVCEIPSELNGARRGVPAIGAFLHILRSMIDQRQSSKRNLCGGVLECVVSVPREQRALHHGLACVLWPQPGNVRQGRRKPAVLFSRAGKRRRSVTQL